MRTADISARLLRDERGFTIGELSITITIMIIVLFSLHSIFEMSLRVYSYGHNKVEATERTRVALEKMEREIRQASPYNPNAQPPDTDMHLFDQRTATQIRFGNDLNGSGAIECPNSIGQCEKIGYRLVGTTLGRDSTSTGATNSTALAPPDGTGNLRPVAENVQSLTFTYYDRNGVTPVATEANIDRVQVSLVVSVDQGVGRPGTQTLRSVIDLRNR